MNISDIAKRAAKQIFSSWPAWEEEASIDATVEQDGQAYDFTMKRYLAEAIQAALDEQMLKQDEDCRELSQQEFIQLLLDAGWPKEEAEAEFAAIQRGERD